MSALPPKADINRGDRHVCFVADIGHSFDYLVGAGEQIVRNYKAERFGRLEIDNGLELGRLHNRKVGRFLTLEDAAGVESDLPVRLG
jgi:hypothetical protein